LTSRLSSLIGRMHARYISEVMQAFEDGDFDAALKRAIPLGRDGQIAQLLAWTTPSPRTSLEISRFGSNTQSALGLGQELFSSLEQLYRDAYERLTAAGRIDEAAFVLADLLCAAEEAVAFLERHGRLQLAAELAEGRDLAPGLRIRQWFLAGDKRRAIETAWRHGAVLDAVSRLERAGQQDAATSLRLLWADARASTGDYEQAVDVALPVVTARELVRRWIRLAVAQGGPTGARMLARQAAFEPTAFDEVRSAVLALLEDTAADLAPARMAFADELGRLPASPETATLARPAVRALVRDVASLGVSPGAMRPLVERCDAAFGADVPSLEQRTSVRLAERGVPFMLRLSAEEAGDFGVEDLAFLPDGRLILALGETGVRILSRDGRRAALIDQPVSRLVVAERSDRAIGLVRRGEVQRLCRLDLTTRRGESWCEARVTAFAGDFDGRCWFVSDDDALHAIDVTPTAGHRFESHWRVGDVHASWLRRVPKALQLLVHTDGNAQLWIYETPSLTLRRRETVPGRETIPELAGFVVLDDGSLLSIMDEADGKTRFRSPSGNVREIPLSRGARLAGVQAASDWILLTEAEPEARTVRMLDTGELRERASFRLEGASRVALRVSDQRLAIGDDRGRVLVLDLEAGRLLRDLRT
jgi:hypothetical protein